MRQATLTLLVGSALITVTCSGGGEQGESDADEPTVAFPDPEWATGDPEDLEFDAERLDELADEARTGGADCLVVVRHGRIAAEWYWNDTYESTGHQLFSITKSYTSTLVGIAQEDGLLDVDDATADYIPEWKGSPSEDVTIRQLLDMVSGREAITVVKPEVATEYLGSPDLTAVALGRPQLVPPGILWALNEGDVQALDAIPESAIGMQPDHYATERLLGPLGDRRTTMAKDPASNTIMDAFAQSTCRDVARLGHLVLQRGRWGGQQLVSEAFTPASRKVSS